jgi:EmrB/QacA subfamily drug resistance transporter
MILIARAVQGAGGGALQPLSQAILLESFPPERRGVAMAVFALGVVVAPVIGPTLGGWLTDHISWRATFYVNLPVGIIAIAAIYFEFPDIRPQAARRVLDWAGVFTLLACMGPLLMAFTWVTEYGWGSGRVETLLAIAVVMLIAFLYSESKAVEPLIPLTLFKDPVIRVSSICMFVLGMGMFGMIIYLPLFMQGVLGVSATQSGTLMTPMMLGSVTGSFLGGQMTYRMRSYKVPGVLGSVLVTCGMTIFAVMDASTPRIHVVFGMILTGLGMGLLQPVYTVAVQNVAPRAQMGAATASTIFFRAIGSTVGVALFGSVLLTNYHAEFGRRLPPGVPQEGLKFFNNPLLLVQMRPQIETLFSRLPNGLELMHILMENVRESLVHGLHLIFVSSACVMGGAVVLNLLLKNVPLRTHHAPSAEPAVH